MRKGRYACGCGCGVIHRGVFLHPARARAQATAVQRSDTLRTAPPHTYSLLHQPPGDAAGDARGVTCTRAWQGIAK